MNKACNYLRLFFSGFSFLGAILMSVPLKGCRNLSAPTDSDNVTERGTSDFVQKKDARKPGVHLLCSAYRNGWAP